MHRSAVVIMNGHADLRMVALHLYSRQLERFNIHAMRKRIIPLLFFALLCSMRSSDFKSDQLRYERVRNAYELKGDSLTASIEGLSLELASLSIYVRAFKHEGELEVYVTDADHDSLILYKTYDFCMLSGQLGPKRKQGDYQVPEGYYTIDRFNPVSSFHLSLGIDYPNRSDQIRKSASDPGGDIFIHGDCVSIGCIPITDDLIREFYILCVEARNAGQLDIPVHIFPFRMTDENMRIRGADHHQLGDVLDFWSEIQPGYSYFEKHNKVPKFTIGTDGMYSFIE